MYQAYRCEVCGEVYLGTEGPGECPFCGAHEQFLKAVDNEELHILRRDSISKRSMGNIKTAIQLEVDNAGFYFGAASKTEDENWEETFERLGEIEKEHAEALSKLGDVEEREVPEVESSSDLAGNLRDSHRREERAIEAYRKFAEEASEDEVQKFFDSLVEIENDHLGFSERKLKEME